MNKNKFKEAAAVFTMLVLVSFGYLLFYNRAFSGNETQGTHIWLSASTVKFVNNWLKEGPVKLNFIMYECPDSIEFNNINERSAYISYPPGAMIPPYLLAKLLHKNEIQVSFIKQFLVIKFLLDTLLVCLIILSILRVTLCLKDHYSTIITSVVLTLCWMCLPTNLYYLRNVYFVDQGVITVVLLFILLEIYDKYFFKKPLLKCLCLCLKFSVSLYGVLTDYYFLFVLFVSWLVKIIPLIKSKERYYKIIFASLPYVLPVILGLGLFWVQIRTVPDHIDVLFGKAKDKIYSEDNLSVGNRFFRIARRITVNYSLLGVIAVIMPFVCIFDKMTKRKLFPEKYDDLFGIMTIIYAPPVFHILVLQTHSVQHEFSMLKFALPVIILFLVLTVLILDKKNMLFANFVMQMENHDNSRNIKIPLLYSLIIVLSVLFTIVLNGNSYYYQSRIGSQESYERETLIRSNYSFNDVYFSFTESIAFNPPEYLAVSKKEIYKIDTISDVSRLFPNLSSDARCLLMINDDKNGKTIQILEKEQAIIASSRLLFFSQNYEVYEMSVGSIP